MKPASRAALSPRLLLLTAILCGACAEEFAPYNRLQDLRVLAIRSEPVAPAPGETTRLDALVFAPAGQTVEYAWSWCPLAGPANDGYPCLVSEEQLRALAMGVPGIEDLPPRDLGTGPTAELPHRVPEALLTLACEGMGRERPPLADCDAGGLPVTVFLRVRTATDEVQAVRTLRLRRAIDTQPNTNPTVGALTWLDAAGAAVGRLDDPQAPVSLVRRERAKLGVTVPAEAAERFEERVGMAMTMAAQERLFLTWFAESGSFKNERTALLPDVDRALVEDPFRNEWRPARTEDYPRTESRVIVVIRDNRGGVGWTEGAATLKEAP
jgi:hypothetical protein